MISHLLFALLGVAIGVCIGLAITVTSRIEG